MIAIGLCFGEQLPCLAPDALGFLEEIKAAALLLLISGLATTTEGPLSLHRRGRCISAEQEGKAVRRADSKPAVK